MKDPKIQNNALRRSCNKQHGNDLANHCGEGTELQQGKVKRDARRGRTRTRRRLSCCLITTALLRL